MFGSDVLDAAAIGAGAALLGGIVAGLFSLFTTIINSKAKRREIAYERQIEALREVYEALFKYSDSMVQIDASGDIDDLPTEVSKTMYKSFENNSTNFDQVYMKNAIFIPNNIDELYRSYINEVQPGTLFTIASEVITPAESKEQVDKHTHHIRKILMEIRKYLYM